MTTALIAMAAAVPPQPNPAGQVADLLSDLARNSPFVPAAGASVAGDAAQGELELRGVVWDGAGYRFSVFNPGTGESVWTGLNEDGLPFRARSFDRERDTLTVDFNGRVLILTLPEATLNESAGAPNYPSPTPLPGPADNQPQGNMQNRGPGNGVSDAAAQDARRLQEAADEIRRRRGVGPAPTPPQNLEGGPVPQPAPPGSTGPQPMPTPPNLGSGPVPQNDSRNPGGGPPLPRN